MKHRIMRQKAIALLVLSIFAIPAQASVISVSGGLASLGGVPNAGGAASIIAAPADINDDAAANTAQQGFNEVQNHLLTSNLAVDGGMIASGTMVNSHMIFLNTGPGNDGTLGEHFNVTWGFDGIILGVMSNSNGSLEVNSSSVLGAAGTSYPGAAFNARGMEGNPLLTNCNVNDCYRVLGTDLLVTMRVTEPGDWIRVVTLVPEPGTITLLGLGLLGLGSMRRSKR